MSNEISIIVPVYNVESYIARCIDSVLCQIYEEFELLLIDDGSTDTSGDICDYYASLDKRIKVFHTINRGRSSARNFGLDNAKSKWIVFIDSDDYVGKEYLQCMVEANPNWDPNLLVSQGYCSINDDGSHNDFYPEMNMDNWRITNENGGRIVSENSLLHYQAVWGRLFNKEIIEKYSIKFNTQINHSEDAVFLHKYMVHVTKYFFISAKEYYYRVPRSDKTPPYDYNEILCLSIEYSKLVSSLIRHFKIKDRCYIQRIVDMLTYRLGVLLFDENCPKDIRGISKKISRKAIYLRPICSLGDIKILLRFIIV